jgi:hypothetical protein
MTYESTLRGKRMRACQIAVSDDKGRTWGFISGSRGAIDSLRKIAPELLAAIEDDIQPVEIGGLAVVDSAAWDRCFREPELPRGTGSVSVSLAWPDNIRRHVTRTMTRLVEGPNGMTSRRSTMSYEMIGEQSDEGYKILFGGVEVTYSEGLPEEDLLVRLDHASNCLGDWPVNFVVNDAAEIPRLTNLDEVGSELRRRYLAIQGVDSNPTARRMIETLLSEPVLTQRALGTWNKMVQVWHGNTFGFSRVFHHANEVVGMVVESDLTYSVHPSPVPVEDSGAKLIRLYVHQVPTGDVTSLIESFSKLQLPTGLSPLAEVTTWADASQELVPERFVKLLTFTIHDRGSRRDFRSGTRWEYRFEPPRK